MRIQTIFAPHLWAFHYEEDRYSEGITNCLMQGLTQWQDAEYLTVYLTQNKELLTLPPPYKGAPRPPISVSEAVQMIVGNVQNILKALYDAAQQDSDLDFDGLFYPLTNGLYEISPARFKAYFKTDVLDWPRIYALRVDSNAYIITGLVLKLVKEMKDHRDTQTALLRLGRGRDFLNERNIADRESLETYLEEEED